MLITVWIVTILITLFYLIDGSFNLYMATSAPQQAAAAAMMIAVPILIYILARAVESIAAVARLNKRANNNPVVKEAA